MVKNPTALAVGVCQNEIINNFVSNNNPQDFYNDEYDDIDEDKLRNELVSEFETDIYGKE